MNTKIAAASILSLAVCSQAHGEAPPYTEISPACGECTYSLKWPTEASVGRTGYHEVYLSDENNPGTHDLIYRGLSSSLVLTVAGVRTARIRSCNRSGCSAFSDQLLRPEPNLTVNPIEKGLIVAKSVPMLLHPVDDDVATGPVPRHLAAMRTPVWPLNTDLSATGQQSCMSGGDFGERTWNLGTHMAVQLTADIRLVVKNRLIVEYQGGNWFWQGDIVQGPAGSVALLVNQCDETAYVSVSTAEGDYALQPSAATPIHFAYATRDLDATDPDVSCATPASGSPLPGLVTEVNEPSAFEIGDRYAHGRKKFTSVRPITIDAELLPAFGVALSQMAGDDPHHQPGWFIQPRLRIDLIPGISTELDFRCGEFATRGSNGWEWVGHLPGDVRSGVNIAVSNERSPTITVETGGNRYTIANTRHDIYLLTQRPVTKH